jgi:hypothetical protein
VTGCAAREHELVRFAEFQGRDEPEDGRSARGYVFV